MNTHAHRPNLSRGSVRMRVLACWKHLIGKLGSASKDVEREKFEIYTPTPRQGVQYEPKCIRTRTYVLTILYKYSENNVCNTKLCSCRRYVMVLYRNFIHSVYVVHTHLCELMAKRSCAHILSCM